MSVIPEKAARDWGSPSPQAAEPRSRVLAGEGAPVRGVRGPGKRSRIGWRPRPGLGEPPAAELGAQVRLKVPPGWCRLRSVRSLHFLGRYLSYLLGG